MVGKTSNSVHNDWHRFGGSVYNALVVVVSYTLRQELQEDEETSPYYEKEYQIVWVIPNFSYSILGNSK
jgi:hypothetical protein